MTHRGSDADPHHSSGGLPALPTDHLSRPRVTALLGGSRTPLVVVVAPAGFGKTTAVVDWLTQSSSPVTWVALENHDDELVVFFTQVALALEPLCGSGQVAALVSSSSGLAAGDRALAAAMVDDLGAAPDGAIIVIDDLHHITSESVRLALQYVIDHLPPDVTLVILSRSDPPLALARLRASGRVIEVRAADLAFNDQESKAVFEATGNPIQATLVARLNERIEGWAVGLRMAALSLEGRSDVEDFVESFSGDDRFIADYLLEEVLDRETTSFQRFIIESSLLEELEADLCRAALDEPRSAEILDDLVRRNVFLLPVGSSQHRFRYHQLFAELLRARVERRAPERAREVLRGAAAWCERTGDLDRALRYRLRCGDVETATALVARHAPRLLSQGEVSRHQVWLGLFEPSVVQADPRLLLTRACAKVFADRPQEALLDIERIENLATDDFFAANRGQIELAQAMAGWFGGNHIDCIEHAQRSLDLLAEKAVGSRSVSHLYWGVAELVVGSSTEAASQLKHAQHLAERSGGIYTAFSARLASGALALREGDLGQAQFRVRSARDLVQDMTGSGRDFPIGGAAHLGMAVVAYEQLELDATTDACRRSLADLRKTTAVDYISVAYRRWADAQSLQDNHVEAAEIVAEARQHLGHFGESRVMAQGLDACEARIALRSGDLDLASHLIDQADAIMQRGRREFDSPRFEQRATAVRLDLVRGKSEDAEADIDELGQLAGEWVGPQIEVRVLSALAAQASSKASIALAEAAKAVNLAAPGGWLRPFVDADPAVRALLNEVQLADHHEERLAERLQKTTGSNESIEDRPQPLIDPLTARELEVLAEVAAGYTNAEIAERLYISVGTTKRHVANIFVKLPARHRAEAVARARSLNIID